MEVFPGETGEGEDNTKENVIFGKVLTSTRCYQAALECKLHLCVPTLSKEKELQASALVIGQGCLGQVGMGNKL